jgi:hypothetical protein
VHGEKPASSSFLEGFEAELLLEVLVVALNVPAHCGNVSQTCQQGACGQRCRLVRVRPRLCVGPLDQQPFLVARSKSKAPSKNNAVSASMINGEFFHLVRKMTPTRPEL